MARYDHIYLPLKLLTDDMALQELMLNGHFFTEDMESLGEHYTVDENGKLLKKISSTRILPLSERKDNPVNPLEAMIGKTEERSLFIKLSKDIRIYKNAGRSLFRFRLRFADGWLIKAIPY